MPEHNLRKHNCTHKAICRVFSRWDFASVNIVGMPIGEVDLLTNSKMIDLEKIFLSI